MIIGYTKLFNRILVSSIWSQDDKTRLVWITLLALADSNGIVESSLPGLASMARVDVTSTRAALDKFLAPDPETMTAAFEGRRIEAVEGGWRLLNHAKFRAMLSKEGRRIYKREKQREYRERDRKNGSSKSIHDNRARRYAQADADGDTRRADEIAGEGLPERPEGI